MRAMLVTPMLARLSKARDLADALDAALRDFVALHGAEMGDVQLCGADGALVIVAARGVNRAFLETFARVRPSDGSACGRAARTGKPTFIPDVSTDPQYAAYQDFAAKVPFTSVLSCPLTGTAGELIGMISALSATRFQPTTLELQAAASFCAALSGAITRLKPAEPLAEWAEKRAAWLRA
jgi:GAF domain-containing protein